MKTIRRHLNLYIAISAVSMSSIVHGAGTVVPGKSGGVSFSPTVVQGLNNSIVGFFGSSAPDLVALNPTLSSLKGIDLSNPEIRVALAPVFAAVQFQAQQVHELAAASPYSSVNAVLANKFIALDMLGGFQLPETRPQVAQLSRAYYDVLPAGQKEQIRTKLLMLKMESIVQALGVTAEGAEIPSRIAADPDTNSKGSQRAALSGIPTKMPDTWKLQPSQKVKSNGHIPPAVEQKAMTSEGAAWGPLSKALLRNAYGGTPESVQEVLNKGANMRVRDRDGSTPLHFAVSGRRPKNVAVLLANDADVEADENWGTRALHLALISGHSAETSGTAEILDLLINVGKADVNAENGWGRTPLYLAARSGDVYAVNLLLSRAGINVHPQNADEGTPLHAAASYGHIVVVALLLDKGKANIDVTEDWHGRTALHFAASSGQSHVVDFLLRKGAATNIRDSTGRTALDIAEDERWTALRDMKDENVRMRVLDSGHTSAEALAAEKENSANAAKAYDVIVQMITQFRRSR